MTPLGIKQFSNKGRMCTYFISAHAKNIKHIEPFTPFSLFLYFLQTFGFKQLNVVQQFSNRFFILHLIIYVSQIEYNLYFDAKIRILSDITEKVVLSLLFFGL